MVFFLLMSIAAWCFVMAAVLRLNNASYHAAAAFLLEGLAISAWQVYRLAPEGSIEFAFKLDGIGLNTVIWLYCGTVFAFMLFPPSKFDLLGRLLWASLFFIESYSLLIERIGCNLLAKDLPWEFLQFNWAQGTAAGVCERMFSDAFVVVPLSVQVLVSTLLAAVYLGWIPKVRGRL